MADERVIEKSRRPDGTMRKEIRVRAGFKSEELDLDTRAYQSKGALRKKELEGYVPGAVPVEAKKTEAEKRKERRERKKLAAKDAKEAKEEDSPAADPETSTTKAASTKAVAAVTGKLEKTSISEEAAGEGSLRKLQKLLRQIVQLEEDVKAGKTLTPEQSTKLGRKSEIEAQIAALS